MIANMKTQTKATAFTAAALLCAAAITLRERPDSSSNSTSENERTEQTLHRNNQEIGAEEADSGGALIL